MIHKMTAGTPPHRRNNYSLAAIALCVHLAFGTGTGAAQDRATTAQAIYTKTADSVVLVETRDTGNQPVGQATAFIIGPGLLLTNAHAVVGSSVWVRVGAVAIPLTIERTDQFNDLALLRVTGELSAQPLSLASQLPNVGARIFAIGNPKGFERTISEGLATGVRTVEGRSLLQISAPISPGSSGGPVLDEAGQIVGVAVGVMPNAQNLNFAVPATVVAAFLANKLAAKEPATVVAEVRGLVQERNRHTWSQEETSRYRQLSQEIAGLVREAVPSLQSEDLLAALAKELRWTDTDLGVEIARRRLEVAPKSGAALLGAAEALREAAIFANASAELALYREAEQYAARASDLATAADRRERLLLLGEIQTAMEDRRKQGIATLLRVVVTIRDETSHKAALSLFSANQEIGQAAEARKWFRFAEAMGHVNDFYYADYAKLLAAERDFQGAAEGYLRASSTSYRYRCDAAHMFSLANRNEESLANARACLDAAANAKNGDANVEWAHRLLSLTLADRGVVDQAINHARQAIAIDPESGLAFSALASALNKAERWSEAEAAARSAIRLTDGAHSFMHFSLGTALVGQERWSEAKGAYEQAAGMDATDDSATYNVAICLIRMRFYRDAATWYEETLRRNPKRTDAPYLKQRIQELRP